ncbi:MAG: DUF4350 domain-containing protein [Marinilabiliaceae bacterium]|nr:DUF4350 domain-containing protein [Marinilabiliaceae bacterium]
MRKNKAIISAVSVGILLFALLVIITPKPIDWSLSFSKKDKIPYGNSILYNLLPVLFPNNKIIDCHTPLSELDNNIDIANYIIINQTFNPDSVEVENILSRINQGTNLFIATTNFGTRLENKFKLKFNNFQFNNIFIDDSTVLNFANRKLKTAQGYSFKKLLEKRYFSSYDSTVTSVLGYNQQGKTNFIKINYGKGNIYLNTTPLAFCNYSMLKNDNYEYIFKCLSYLPQKKTIWDEYYKPGKMLNRSKLEFILKNESLKYAWYVLIIGILIYFIFETKRRQRIIPIIQPLENTSLKFIETIGRLYFNRKDHLDLAQKKYIYFNDFVRTTYHIQIKELTQEGLNELSEKSGMPVKIIKQILEFGEYLNKMENISEEGLIEFNKKIELFYKQCK